MIIIIELSLDCFHVREREQNMAHSLLVKIQVKIETERDSK